MDDEILFKEGDETETSTEKACWKVMVVDDEKEIHDITKLALKNFVFLDKRLEFVSAFNESEAKELINKHPDTVLILLDVVMDHNDGGLEVVRYIREELKNKTVRIVLRTGQPGLAPENSIIVAYDINDYKDKNELTSKRLFTTLVSSIRSYIDLENIKKITKNEEKITGELQFEKEVIKLKENLTSMLIHDFKSPLNVISSHHEMWGKEVAFTENNVMSDQLGVVNEATDMLREMIYEQMQLKQLEEGKFIVNYQPVDLNELIFFICKHFNEYFNEAFRFENTNSPELPLLMLDRGLVRRILMNLMENALNHTFEGTVAISTAYENGLLTIKVSDTGVGIAEEDLKHLFNKFYQSSKRINGGSHFGVGLSFCDFAVKSMNGLISVESKVGVGSTFIIKIPVEKTEDLCKTFQYN